MGPHSKIGDGLFINVLPPQTLLDQSGLVASRPGGGVGLVKSVFKICICAVAGAAKPAISTTIKAICQTMLRVFISPFATISFVTAFLIVFLLRPCLTVTIAKVDRARKGCVWGSSRILCGILAPPDRIPTKTGHGLRL